MGRAATVAFVLAAGAAAAVACSTSKPTERDAPVAPGRMHTVAAGETVWDLARASGLTVEEIVEVNGLRSADEIAEGQVLYLPAGLLPAADVPATAERDDVVPTPADGDARLVWPVDGVVLRSFASGKRAYDGLLIAAPAGTKVRAADAGEVAFVGDQRTAFGLLVLVRHADDVVAVYGHLDRADVSVGQHVTRGQAIGVVGTSGGAESPRLHFQLRRGRTAVDPTPLLPPE
ncbi:MAG: peptidoglycan DD-metalloendopeptidase family protein [Deltaproteobacteria bacterium]|nr:peptidoglycan DD-metalloendopeptidase family protein [Deltaproteobacteria bacterium]